MQNDEAMASKLTYFSESINFKLRYSGSTAAAAARGREILQRGELTRSEKHIPSSSSGEGRYETRYFQDFSGKRAPVVDVRSSDVASCVSDWRVFVLRGTSARLVSEY